jgi:hypothetical protein
MGTPESLEQYYPWILEEQLTEVDPEIMAEYYCCLYVETPESMYGEYWVVAEAEDYDGLLGTFDENEYWFFNPIIALTVDGELDFGDGEGVRPGTYAYADTLLLGNDADQGSGVWLQMFISGTDFYDSNSYGTMCPTSNVLALSNFAYFATDGAHETQPYFGARNSGPEGYYDIPYETGSEPDREEIIEGDGTIVLNGVVYDAGNVLAPGAEIAITFRLWIPEPCNGNFDTGSLFFWGEAI